MSVAFLTLFIANNLIGWLGSFYERMMPSEFWLMHAGIAAAGALLVTLFGRPIRWALNAAAPLRVATAPAAL